MRYVINTSSSTKSNTRRSRQLGNVLKGTYVDGLRLVDGARHLCTWLASQAAGLHLVRMHQMAPVAVTRVRLVGTGAGRSCSRLPGLLGGPESRSHVRVL